MDYYEELGLSPQATPEEIRQAYRRLARLLHPDRLQDPELRRLADCQMKRLNAVYAVLSDPDKRRAYDLERERGRATASAIEPAIAVGWSSRVAFRRNAPWVVAALAASVAIWGWLARHPGMQPVRHGIAGPGREIVPVGAIEPAPAPPRTGRNPPPAPAGRRESFPRATPPSDELERLRQALADAEAQRDAALAQLSRLTQSSRPVLSPEEEALGASAEPALPAPPATSPGETGSSDSASFPSGLAGAWSYIPQTADFASRDMYPPEYIDLVITEQQGFLRGRYWGRYRVPDRAISPEVFFRFEGELNEEGVYRWVGRGGARGEVRLRLISPEALQVVWLASELGRQMGLGSGTAVLVRQKRGERP